MDIFWNRALPVSGRPIGFYFPDGDESRIAIIEQAILTSSIENNTVTVAFSDSWNSSGTTVITFEEDRIIYELKDVVSGSGAWGVSEGKYYFVRDDSAEEETGDFDDDFYEYEEVKASEILADMGITEDEFRESCTLMHWSSAEGIVGTDQLLEYPENYIGKRLVMGINNYIEKKYERGFIGLDHKRVSEDAVTYVTTYYEFTLVITDLRVDVYSPSITTNDSICPYMIFTGVDPDGSLCFDMISVDIS